MPDPRRRLRGLPDLGRAIDERIAASCATLDIRHDGGAATAAPFGAGGSGGTPAFPESYVTALSAGGGVPRSGAIDIAAAGTLTIDESAGAGPPDRVFTLTGKSLLAVDPLPVTGDPALLYLDTGDGSLWHDPAGDGSWVELLSTVHWSRDGLAGQLYPTAAGDDLLLPADSMLLKVAGGSESEDFFKAYNSGDVPGTDYARFRAFHTGTLLWGEGGANPEDCGLGRIEAGVLGPDTATVWRVQLCEELSEQDSAPAAPEAGQLRLYVLDDRRVYARESGGAVHDLSVAQRQAFPAIGAGTGTLLLPWTAAAFGSPGATLPGGLSALGQSSFTMPGPTMAGAGTQGAAYVRLSWVSTAGGGSVADGAQVAVATPLRRIGGTASARCRVRVNDPARFSNIYLSLCDDAGTPHSSSIEFRGSLSANTWYEAALPDVDVSAWTAALRVVLTAQGTTSALNVGATSIDLEWLEVTQWSR